MRSKSLHRRFQWAVVSVAGVMAILVAIVLYLSAKSHYLENSEASARAIAAAVQQTVAVGVYARDEVLLKELLDGLAHHPAVARVGVRDAAGVTMAAKANPDAGLDATDANAPAKPTFQSPLVSPFRLEGHIGDLQVWLNYQRMNAEAGWQAAQLVVAITVLLAGVLGVFSMLARRMLSQPMHRLAAELAMIMPGTARRISINPRHAVDEVGIVTTAVNRLLELQQDALERERGMREEISALEARYRGIFDSTSAGIFILSPAGQLLHANPAFERLLHLQAGQEINAHAEDFISTFFVRSAQLLQLIERARTSLEPEAEDLELIRPDGTKVWVHCMVSCMESAGAPEQYVEGVLYDITRRKNQESAARYRAEHDALTGLKSRSYIEALLGQHIHAVHPGHDPGDVTLMFIDLDGFKSVNDRWGHAAGDAVLVEAAQRLRMLFQRNCDVIGRLGGDELVVIIAGVDALHPSVSDLAQQLIDSFKAPFVLPNGESARVGASVGVASYPAHATSVKTLIHAADAAMYAVKQAGKGGIAIAETGITSQDEDAAASRKEAGLPAAVAPQQRDALTGLVDRRHLLEQLASERGPMAGGEGPTGVICLDIDQFKLLNVAHGTQVGDEVLCETARRLKRVLRRGDTLARTGSDEFVVLLRTEGRIDHDARHLVEGVAAKLLHSLAAPFNAGQGSLNIRASAGISLIHAHTASGLDALREAQLALRRSKTQGGNHPVFFEENMLAGFHERLALEQDLHAAIGSEQLFLQIQPQHDARSQLTGGEALLRWRHPERGMVPPDQFIALAEASGLIIELGTWVLKTGCRILADLHREDPSLTLAINISPAQFKHPGFVDEVRHALAATGACASGLILEITEGLLITDVNHAAERLAELVELGVRFSIDDFGTGFSSLAYLRQLPLYEIKIDRSFINGLPGDTASVGIVCSILSMGSHLGLHVVAEGVETQEQSDFLQANRCPSQQGWLHGRPMPEETFLESVRARRAVVCPPEAGAPLSAAPQLAG
ncbi:diguanylate cyclase [Acidovorax sp. NCPPB 3859]|nr:MULTISPECIES: diguanylate cyclase [unclassified Acidovorax]MDA8448511.1 diguanylate cyclase [Acidovorax sp. GBBC 3297]MDA8457522.1 diguanylate cyclase [Acidovorax sp. GBBC 3333]MDA8462954.1 diguanylate cyclase [Acidovorax sp. GBBC 3332]MDA8467592.1 diguanylate cyclase [Acidovorax sp. GBBC 3299]WCM77673.1 diguanylate cyclase [Acidovorax sp. GBBC 712]